jgi:signal transduction histidine kinase
MTMPIRARILAIIGALSLTLGLGGAISGFVLIARANSFLRIEDERKLLSIAREYSRRLLDASDGAEERGRLETESAFIAERGAFIAAYSRYRTELSLRWAAAAFISIAALSAAAFWIAVRLARSVERDALRKRAEESSRQWRSTGRILAHEIKNALSPVSLDVGFLRSGMAPEDEGAEAACLERMDKNVKRIARLLASFREFSELPGPRLAETSVGKALSAAAAQAGLSSILDPAQAEALVRRRVYTDPEYLALVFTNVLKNAREAGSSRVAAHWRGRALVLTDDGPGLPASIAERVAREGPRPGMGSKPGGSGMGLYIVFEISKMMGIGVSLKNLPEGLETRMEFPHG